MNTLSSSETSSRIASALWLAAICSTAIDGGCTKALVSFEVDAGADASSDAGRDVGIAATAGTTVSAAAPFSLTTESGGQVTVTLVLRSQPAANVSFQVSVSKPAEATVDATELVFTSGNWNEPQTITVSGEDDAIDDGDQAFSLVLAAAVSTDAVYAGMNPDDVALTNEDDDTAGLSVSAPSPANETTEYGGQVAFTVALQSQPLADVTVPVGSTLPAEGLPDTSQLVFTAGNWNVPQTVTVSGEADGVADGDQSFDATLGESTSADPLYAGLMAAVSLLNVDTPACVDGTSVYTDISAGQPALSGLEPAAVIDVANGKLLVVTQDGANGNRPALFRCNLDGSACTYADISAGQGAGSGLTPSAVIDTANAKLLVVARNDTNDGHPALYRCELDGTGCTHTDISAGQGNRSGTLPSAVIDVANGKLLVATTNGTGNAWRGALFRCNLDGSACTYTDFTAAVSGGYTGLNPVPMIDTANGKVLIVARQSSSGVGPALYPCDLDATGCGFFDMSAGQGTYDNTQAVSAMLDYAGGRVLAVTQNQGNSNRPALFRCNLDGSGCTYTDISAGQGTASGLWPSGVIDTTAGKLLVVTQNGANVDKPALFRCNLDGSGCTYANISAQGASSGMVPSAVLDDPNGRLLVVTQNDANGSRLALFSVCVR